MPKRKKVADATHDTVLDACEAHAAHHLLNLLQARRSAAAGRGQRGTVTYQTHCDVELQFLQVKVFQLSMSIK